MAGFAVVLRNVLLVRHRRLLGAGPHLSLANCLIFGVRLIPRATPFTTTSHIGNAALCGFLTYAATAEGWPTHWPASLRLLRVRFFPRRTRRPRAAGLMTILLSALLRRARSAPMPISSSGWE